MANTAWQIALKLGTTGLQDIVKVNLSVDNTELIQVLLSTQKLICDDFETEQGNFLLMYAGEYERPHPSILIWRYRLSGDSGEERIIEDMREEDSWILEPIWKEWMTPAGFDVEFIPPEKTVHL